MNNVVELPITGVMLDADGQETARTYDRYGIGQPYPKWPIEKTRAALRHISPDLEYPKWRDVASAILTEYGRTDAARDLFVEWSRGALCGKPAQKFKSHEIQRHWDSFEPGHSTVGTVDYLAREGGWNPEASLLERVHQFNGDGLHELLAEIAAAELTEVELEESLNRLKQVSGIGKTALAREIKKLRADLPAKGRVSQADILLELGRQAELWKSDEPRPRFFATIDKGDCVQHMPLSAKSITYTNYLTHLFYEKTGKSPSKESLVQAIGVLTGLAQEEGDTHSVWLRIAEHEGKLYLDLADERRTAIEISDSGWRAVTRPPVRFLRGAGKAIPMPIRGGQLADLKRFINVRDDGELMKLAAVCVAALRPGYPYPILILTGEHGTAKSTASKLLKSLIDPSVAPGRGLPKQEDDLVITAYNNYIVVGDNLSGISGEMSDALCRLSTGGGIAKRELYSDAEEFAIETKRPIILNGINIPTNRQDLLDRAVVVNLEPITDKGRKEERTLMREFEQARPLLLGVLLDGAVAALAGASSIRVDRLPRMADFARWAAAAMQAWAWKPEDFLKEYSEMRESTIADAGRSDAVVDAIVKWIGHPQCPKQFYGTATDLLNILNATVESFRQDRSWAKEVNWPNAANQLTRRLRTSAAGLRALGVGFDSGGSTSNRLVKLWWKGAGEPDWEKCKLSPEQFKLVIVDAQRLDLL